MLMQGGGRAAVAGLARLLVAHVAVTVIGMAPDGALLILDHGAVVLAGALAVAGMCRRNGEVVVLVLAVPAVGRNGVFFLSWIGFVSGLRNEQEESEKQMLHG